MRKEETSRLSATATCSFRTEDNNTTTFYNRFRRKKTANSSAFQRKHKQDVSVTCSRQRKGGVRSIRESMSAHIPIFELRTKKSIFSLSPYSYYTRVHRSTFKDMPENYCLRNAFVQSYQWFCTSCLRFWRGLKYLQSWDLLSVGEFKHIKIYVLLI